MFTTHLVAYSRTTAIGTEAGIARVGTDFATPTWTEVAADIPGLLSMEDLGVEPKYTLRYANATGPCEKRIGSGGIGIIGPVLVSSANRGEVWDIEVFDADGVEITFDFQVFAI